MQHPFAKRRKRLRQKMKSLGIPAMLVTDIKNVMYLTGFTGSSANLFVTSSSEILLSDSRYQTQLATECSDLQLDIRTAASTMLDSVVRIASDWKLDTIGFEAHRMAKSDFDALAGRLAKSELVSTTGVIEELRSIKDASEIKAIRTSIAIAQQAFRVIREQLTAHQTERQVAHQLEHQMRAFGATGCAFAPIVGVGPRAALPHGVPSAAKIGDAPLVLVDWGANTNHYLSDLTRMIFTGKVTSQVRKIYQTVLDAQLAAIATMRPGVRLRDVDAAARDVIARAGYGEQFGHGTGHSFGLEIHEQPYLSPIHDGILQTGMVLTVEPGIYIPGAAGVRIEDDVLITTDGHEVLSNLPKELEQCSVRLGDHSTF